MQYFSKITGIRETDQGTDLIIRIPGEKVDFNPRLHYGRRLSIRVTAPEENLISIHASTMGGDKMGDKLCKIYSYFNPRLHYGRRRGITVLRLAV